MKRNTEVRYDLVKIMPHVFILDRLVITATDKGSPRLAGSATLTVIIVDQNDNSPTIPLPREIRIPESESVSGAHPTPSTVKPNSHS